MTEDTTPIAGPAPTSRATGGDATLTLTPPQAVTTIAPAAIHAACIIVTRVNGSSAGRDGHCREEAAVAARRRGT